MAELPSVGARVSLRYRLPAGSAAPLTDVVGYLDRGAPNILVRTKSGDLVDVAADDVVSVRELSHVPVRTSQIRAVEHAAAMAWPGTEQRWLHGWFLRAGHGVTSRANSATPLDLSAHIADLTAVAQWYRDRGLPAWLALPERLLPVRSAGIKATRVLVREVGGHELGPVSFADSPDADWRALYHRDVPLDVLTAVVDGAVTFATIAGSAVARGAVTAAPDGSRWVGISSVRVADDCRRRGHGRAICEALLGWGAEHGARRAYVQVLADNDAALSLYRMMGFRLHHSLRYVNVATLLGPTI